MNPYFSLIRTVWQYGVSWRKTIVGYYVAFIVAQAILGLSPYAFGQTVDILQHFSPERLPEVELWLGLLVVIMLFFWALHGPARVIERRVARHIQQTFRLDLYQKLTQLPLTWHQNHHSGDMITQITRASTALLQFSEYQFLYIEAFVKFLIAVSFLLWISVPVGVVSFLASTTVTLTVIWFDRKLVPLYTSENQVENRAGAVLFDYLSNMTTVLTLRLGELTHAHLGERIRAIWPFFRKEAVMNEVKWFTMMILLTLVQASILIGYIIHTVHTTQVVMIGSLVMIFRYQWDLNDVFRELSINYSELVRMNTDIQGLQPILKDIQTLAHPPAGATTAQNWHTLSISDLSFQHKEGRKKILDHLHFQIKRGEKIALIGSSGGGKSTLMNLLSGAYIPTEVQLTIDGITFNSLEPLKAITTLIPQDPEIFENTVAFNITLDLPATTQELNQAMKLAEFLPILEMLPAGLETDIREKGLNLSVGQKQRLSLARGLFAARFSSLILMDEPTSSVDLPTEKQILAGVLQTFPETAMIVSLHRLHLLPKFDSVIMLHQGTLVAQGSTAELLNSPGPVRDLWLAYQQE